MLGPTALCSSGAVTVTQPSLAVDAHQGLSEALQTDRSGAQCR